MPRATILFADNDADFLNARAEFLEKAGYQVLRAYTLEQARQQLSEARVHVAILDVRMEEDDDPRDISGLVLAKDPAYRVIPKIILTGRAHEYEIVREALRALPEGSPPAVDFVAKQEGPEVLIRAIGWAFAEHVRINWDLDIRFVEPQSFYGWARQISGRRVSDDQLLYERAQEIEDLIRKAFYEHSKVLLDIIPTDREGEVLAWARIQKSKEELIEEVALLRCSTPGAIRAERDAYEEWNRHLPQEWIPRLSWVEGMHFAAVSYHLNSNIETADCLAEYFQWHQAAEFVRVLDDFVDKVGKSIYNQPCLQKQQQTLNEIYRERAGLTSDRVPEEVFQQALAEVVEYIRLQHLVVVDFKPGREVVFHLKGDELVYPDPTLYVYKDAMLFTPPVFYRLTLGNMDGYNILVDRQRRIQLIDFAGIGPAPALSDFIALESKIRFDWVRTADLEMVYAFESQLSTIRPLKEPLEVTETGASDLDKALKVLARLRQLAAAFPWADPLEYHFGILFQAARIIVSDASLDCRAHALIGASMICRSLSTIEP
jgi:CheY-like chemotaxis protein